MAHGTYNMRLQSGDYRYFRIRVPGDYRGGYLRVRVHSRAAGAGHDASKFPEDLYGDDTRYPVAVFFSE